VSNNIASIAPQSFVSVRAIRGQPHCKRSAAIQSVFIHPICVISDSISSLQAQRRNLFSLCFFLSLRLRGNLCKRSAAILPRHPQQNKRQYNSSSAQELFFSQ
jgi:hypothetical protein